MKVQIEDNLFIESDGMQFIIKEYTGKTSTDEKTGKETELFKTHGYFGNVEQALKHVVKMKVMESTVTNLSGLVKDIQRIETYIHAKVTI